MGIQVECPNGHVFKVKDKYAGKKGLCPHCEGQVIVVVPDALSLLNEADEALQQDAIRHRQAAQHPTTGSSSGSHSSSVLDDSHDFGSAPGTSGSLLGSSVIRHNIKCIKCGERVPMWYARCPHCGEYLEH